MNNRKYDGYLYEFPYVETIREFVDATVERYPDRPAYMYKANHGEPFREFTFSEFGEARDSLGTALIDLGLKGSKIAVIGENSHMWALAYFTVVCGAGVIVPIDKNLEKGEIGNLLMRADVEMIFTSRKSLDKVGAAIGSNRKLRHIVLMDLIEAEEADMVDETDEVVEANKAQASETGEDTVADAATDLPADERYTTMSALIRRGRAALRAGNTDYIDAEIQPGDLSTILFTSGTTGMAKGVMLSHMNLSQNVFNMSKFFSIPKAGRVLSVLPMHHAYEMTCTVMTCFYQGACVVICEGLKYIQQNFLEAKCCVMLGVPLIFENMHRKFWNKAEKVGQSNRLRRALDLSESLGLSNNRFIMNRMFRSVHDLFGKDFYEFIVGGAAIDPRVILEFEMMGMPMMQGYGMTENAPIIAMNSDRYGKAASAGKPMPGTEIRIIDQDEHGIGEIICKGPSVMMGYYKDEENTARTLIDGWLYTGDYGYMDEDGFLFITGRKKNVIVTKGGKNIFPEEVEYYLLKDKYINEVIVYGKHDEIKDDLVCTALIYPNYEALSDKGIKSDRDIYETLKKGVDRANGKMPPYKRVKRIEIREDDFIKTTTLKIKRFEEQNYEYKFDDRTFNSGGRIQRDKEA